MLSLTAKGQGQISPSDSFCKQCSLNFKCTSVNNVLVVLLFKAAWLLRIASCIDLTTLAGDDTFANVQRLCFKAKQPIRQDLLAAMGLNDLGRYDVFSDFNCVN